MFRIPILSDTFKFDSRKERVLTHTQSVEPVKSSILKTRSDPAYDIFDKNNFEQEYFLISIAGYQSHKLSFHHKLPLAVILLSVNSLLLVKSRRRL